MFVFFKILNYETTRRDSRERGSGGYAERLGIKYLNGRGMNNYSSDMRNWINLPTLSDAYKNKKVDYSRLPSMLISLMAK